MKNLFLYLFAATCWGLSYLAISIMVEHIPPVMGAALRFAFASLFLLGFMWVQKYPIRLSLDGLAKISLLGLILQGIPMVFLFWGEQYVTPALASILISTTPILVVLFSFFLNHEMEDFASKGLGVLVGFLGILVIFLPQLQLQQLPVTMGMFAVLATASCYAIGNILLKKWGKTIDQWTNITMQVVVASVALFIFSFLTEPIGPLLTITKYPNVILAALYLGVVSSGASWAAFFFLINSIGSIRASTICYPMALVSILADVIYFKKPPTTAVIFGTVLIFLGIFVAQYAPRLLCQLGLRKEKALQV